MHSQPGDYGGAGEFLAAIATGGTAHTTQQDHHTTTNHTHFLSEERGQWLE